MTNVLPLYRRALGDSWRSLIGWSLGVVAAIFLYVPLFPSIGGSPDVQALLDSMPPEMIVRSLSDGSSIFPSFIDPERSLSFFKFGSAAYIFSIEPISL